MSPTFIITINTTLSSVPGRIRLIFYAPPDHDKEKRRPIIVNFHGGGFTLGSARDDARWATAVVQQTGAVVCCVDYRLAPEHPFPTAVEDGADAILHIWEHAEALGIDKHRIGVSGFSAGGNLCFTVPFRLEDVLRKRETSADKAGVRRPQQIVKLIVAWYPKTEFTRPREEGLHSANIPSSAVLRLIIPKLSDHSYIHPPDSVSLKSPYLSPGDAPDDLVINNLPKDIIIYTCEYDALLAEGERFRERLKGLGKNVMGSVVEGVRHGFDRLPYVENIWRENPVMKRVYLEACQEIGRVFNVEMHG